MLDASIYLHNASLILTALALLVAIYVATQRRGEPAVATTSGQGINAPVVQDRPTHGVAWYGDRLIELSLLALTAALLLRAIVTGHAPFANQYEFGSAFAWGVLAVYVWFAHRFGVRTIGIVVVPVVLAMLLYTSNLDKGVAPLIPALQNSPLLTMHVFSAVIGYGAAAVSFAAAVLYLLRDHLPRKRMPSAELLDEIAYRAVVITFPMLTLMNILGALWADIAWGRYWSWDPKETAAFVTWLIYGAYLHARVVADWRGSRSVWLLIVAFAAVLFTFLGNHFLGGLHSYA